MSAKSIADQILAQECLEFANYSHFSHREGFALAEGRAENWRELTEDLFDDVYGGRPPKGKHVVLSHMARRVGDPNLKTTLKNLAKLRDEVNGTAVACVFLDDAGTALLDAGRQHELLRLLKELKEDMPPNVESFVVTDEVHTDLETLLERNDLKKLVDDKKICVFRGSCASEVAAAYAKKCRASRVTDDAKIAYNAAKDLENMSLQMYEAAMKARDISHALYIAAEKKLRETEAAYNAAKDDPTSSQEDIAKTLETWSQATDACQEPSAKWLNDAKGVNAALKEVQRTSQEADEALDDWSRISDQADAALDELDQAANKRALLRDAKKTREQITSA